MATRLKGDSLSHKYKQINIGKIFQANTMHIVECLYVIRLITLVMLQANLLDIDIAASTLTSWIEGGERKGNRTERKEKEQERNRERRNSFIIEFWTTHQLQYSLLIQHIILYSQSSYSLIIIINSPFPEIILVLENECKKKNL